MFILQIRDWRGIIIILINNEEDEYMTNSDEIVQKGKNVLLMLSGGRDSFLSACRLIEQGYCVWMVTYDNGCMSNIAAVQEVANRIIKKYGASRAFYVGVRSVASSLFQFQETFLYQVIGESSKKYPNLRPAQLPCLACHTGMYLESIVYCKTHDIYYIAEGARESQKFFVELPEMIERYKVLTQQYGIELLLPVYKLEDNWERKLELSDRGYIPKTLEPQCWVGCPLRETLNSSEIDSLSKYYDIEMKPKLQNLIDKKIKERLFEGKQVWEDYQGGYIEI